MMTLGYIENLIPISSVPGIKLGLANSVLLLSLYWLGPPISLELMLVKVLLSGYLFGNPQAMQYSLAGGVLSMVAMILMIYGIKGVSPVGAGVAGAVMHNVGQVLLAMLTLRTPGLLYYMAVLVLVGVATGAATGTVAVALMRRLPESLKPKRLHRRGRDVDLKQGQKAGSVDESTEIQKRDALSQSVGTPTKPPSEQLYKGDAQQKTNASLAH